MQLCLTERVLLDLTRSLFQATDEQLMWRVHQQGDPDAFAQLVKRWQGRVLDLCRRMTGDGHRAEDLTQDTFARLFARRESYVPSGKFSTYLWRVALNLCYDELRRRQRRNECPLDRLPNAEADEATELTADVLPPDEWASGQETGALVREALAQLAEPYRAVVVLRHYEDLKFREIAEVLDVPEGTVKSRMAEALTQLRRLLSAHVEPAAQGPPNVRRTPSRQEKSLL